MNQLSIGIIDLGSNSVRFVVFDPPYIGQTPYFNEKVQCGLGRGLGETGRLHPEGVASALKTLTGFKALSDAMGLEDLHAVGTAALRDAADGPEFVERVRRDIGINVKVIDGAEEARLSALGVLQNFKTAQGLMGDLGGGSLELAVIKEDGVHDVLSLQTGVLRVLSHHDRLGYIREHLDTIPPPMIGHPHFYTVGGTWRALASVYYKHNGHPYERLMGKKIKADTMTEFAGMIAGMDQAGLMKTYRVEDRRAELMPIAALILQETLIKTKAETMIVSTSGLRDGVLFEILKNRTERMAS